MHACTNEFAQEKVLSCKWKASQSIMLISPEKDSFHLRQSAGGSLYPHWLACAIGSQIMSTFTWGETWDPQCLLGIFSILCLQTALSFLGFSVWKALSGPSLVRLVKAFFLEHIRSCVEEKNVSLSHAVCFSTNRLVTRGSEKGPHVHKSHFPNRLLCTSNAVSERSRLIPEPIHRAQGTLFILSLHHFKVMQNGACLLCLIPASRGTGLDPTQFWFGQYSQS